MTFLLAHGAAAVARAVWATVAAGVGHLATGAIVALLAWLLGNLAPVVAAAPTVLPTAPALVGAYGHVTAIAGTLLLPAFIVAILARVREPAQGSVIEILARPAAWLLSIIVVPGVVATIEQWVGVVSAGAYGAFSVVPSAALSLQPTVVAGGLRSTAAVVLAVVAALAALACYLEAVGRGVAIDVLVMLWPLVSIGLVVPGARALVRRSVEVLAGLVLLQLVLALTLGLGAAIARANGPTTSDLPVIGAALVVAAALAPALTFGIVPIAEVRLFEATRGLRHLANSGLRRGLEVAGSLAAEVVPPGDGQITIPPYEGYPPPPEVLERAKHDPWVRALVDPPRRRFWQRRRG